MDSQQNRHDAEQADIDSADLALGRKAIGLALGGLSPNQVSWLLAQGVLDGCVRRISHKTLVGSRRRLRELAVRLIDQS